MIEAILKGFAIGLLLVFSVGPVVFTVIKQSVNHGKKGGVFFIIGVWISDIIWIILSNGFSEAIKTLLDFKIPIGIAGCIFLIGMGIYFAFIKNIEPRRAMEPHELAGDVITPSGKKRTNYYAILTSGFIINTLNPAVISFWVIIAASLASVYSLKQRIIIFTACLALNMVADVGKVMGAQYIGKKINDRIILLINRISGVLYLLFGFIIMAGIIYTVVKK